MELNVNQILELIDRMAKAQLGSLELESGSLKLTIRAKGETAAAAPAVLPPVPAAAAVPAAAPAPAEEQPAPAAEPAGQVLTSPIVGTFYAAPGPDRDPFVRVGQRVQSGDVVYIVESMKLMNEVTTPYSGVVAEIYVENAQPVEYGQPIMRIE